MIREEFHSHLSDGLAIRILLGISADKYQLFLTKADEHKIQNILIKILISSQAFLTGILNEIVTNMYHAMQL